MAIDKHDWLSIFEAISADDDWGRKRGMDHLLSQLEKLFLRFPMHRKGSDRLMSSQAVAVWLSIGPQIEQLAISLDIAGEGALAARVERHYAEIREAAQTFDEVAAKPDPEVLLDEELEYPDGTVSRHTYTEVHEAADGAKGSINGFLRTLHTILKIHALVTPTGDEKAQGGRAGADGRPKRGARAAAIEKIEKELLKYLAAARDNIHAQRRVKKAVIKLLPKPSKTQLAKVTGVRYHTLCRCFRDSQELRVLYATFDDVDALMRREPPVLMQVCPSCRDRHRFRCTAPDCTDPLDGRCEDCHQERVHDDNTDGTVDHDRRQV